LVIVAEDIGYMRRIGSPLASVLRDFGARARVPEDIDDLLAGGGAVQSQKMLDPEEYLAGVKAAAHEANALLPG
jgi:hypothetical protein